MIAAVFTLVGDQLRYAGRTAVSNQRRHRSARGAPIRRREGCRNSDLGPGPYQKLRRHREEPPMLCCRQSCRRDARTLQEPCDRRGRPMQSSSGEDRRRRRCLAQASPARPRKFGLRTIAALSVDLSGRRRNTLVQPASGAVRRVASS
jgi:hypothetical protein